MENLESMPQGFYSDFIKSQTLEKIDTWWFSFEKLHTATIDCVQTCSVFQISTLWVYHMHVNCE